MITMEYQQEIRTMSDPTPVRYRDAAGVWHQITVRRTPDGTFEVIDTAGEERRVIDTLAGYGDGPAQAYALARAYANQHHHPDTAAD